MCRFGSAKWFWPNILCTHFAEAGEENSQREECNNYDLTTTPIF